MNVDPKRWTGLSTRSIPSDRSTINPGWFSGAGEGSRTLVSCLGSKGNAVIRRPRVKIPASLQAEIPSMHLN